MTQYILKNLTNSPQMVAEHRIGARETSEPIEIDDRMVLAVKACGVFELTESGAATADAFDAMSDDELRELYEVVAGKKPHHKLGRDKLLETVRADG
jgi:hypothetical protein